MLSDLFCVEKSHYRVEPDCCSHLLKRRRRTEKAWVIVFIAAEQWGSLNMWLLSVSVFSTVKWSGWMSDKILYSLESFSLLNFCVEFISLSYKTGSISKLGPAFIIAHSFSYCLNFLFSCDIFPLKLLKHFYLGFVNIFLFDYNNIQIIFSVGKNVSDFLPLVLLG